LEIAAGEARGCGLTEADHASPRVTCHDAAACAAARAVASAGCEHLPDVAELSVLGVLPTKHNPRYTHDNEVLSVVRERLAQQGIRLFDPINRTRPEDSPTFKVRY
jgi:hypothetical protein